MTKADPVAEAMKLLLWRLRIDEEIELSADGFPTARVAKLIEKHYRKKEDDDDAKVK